MGRRNFLYTPDVSFKTVLVRSEYILRLATCPSSLAPEKGAIQRLFQVKCAASI